MAIPVSAEYEINVFNVQETFFLKLVKPDPEVTVQPCDMKSGRCELHSVELSNTSWTFKLKWHSQLSTCMTAHSSQN